MTKLQQLDYNERHGDRSDYMEAKTNYRAALQACIKARADLDVARKCYPDASGDYVKLVVEAAVSKLSI